MNTQQKIVKLEQELKSLKDSQKYCAHKWDKTKYDPYFSSEMYATGQYEVNGIHQHPIMDSRLINKDRWTRICIKCGLAEHTEQTTEIKQPVKTEPKFS